MESKSVRQRIFKTNTLMVIITLVILIAVNVLIIDLYTESIEVEFESAIAKYIDEQTMEGILRDWTIRRDEFIIFLIIDAAACIFVFFTISRYFTKKLTAEIMEPLNALEEGVERIQNNDLTQEIIYSGDLEFENVCSAFNEMQSSLLSEQEKNQKYEKARTDMIAGISHDLKTPLTAIRGTIKALLDGITVSDDQREKFLKTAYRRTEDMDMLLNQLFYMSKIETGNIPVNFRNFEISEFLNNFVEGKTETNDNITETITFNSYDISAEISADPDQLKRVLDNLLENSRKYSDTDILSVYISLKKADDGIIICFNDNGRGVPADKLPHIFEQFYRCDESRNVKEGSGLGLYIVKHLVESMHGTVWAENSNGFSVFIKFPILIPEGENDNV